MEPANADNKNVSWSSTDESVATVHATDGTAVVTAVGEGTAIVTVTTEDGGYTAQCVVTVLAQAEDEEELPNTGGLPFEVAGLAVLALGVIVKKSKH